MSRRFARNGWPRGSEMFTAGTITASATPHTKGSWVDLDASVSRDICGFYISATAAIHTSANDTSVLMDIGVGSTGNAVDQIKVNNIPFGGWGIDMPLFVPLHVRSGERLAARIQSAVVSKTFAPRIVLCFADRSPGWGGYSEADTYTANTATSGPTTGLLTDNAWDEAVASTTNPIRALTVHLCQPPADTTLQASTFTVDAGWGAAGSEVSLGTASAVTSSAEAVQGHMAPLFIEAEIPAGSRLALRKNSVNDLSGLLIGWR